MVDPQKEASESASTHLTWGVGAVSDRLGIPQPTLRTWERRYQLGPSTRTSGGHRRYTSHDIERVDFMRRLLDRGVTPREAAKAAHDLDAEEVAALVAGEEPDDALLTSDQAVDAILAAVLDADANRLTSLFGGLLRRHGVVASWESVFAPVLVRIGDGWSNGTIDIVSEHVASERLMAELRLHAREHAAPLSRSGVVLASAEHDLHSLPVYALEAALAERGTGSFVLGARVPWHSLSHLAQRTEPDVIFVWATLLRGADQALTDTVESLPAATRLVLGGPGWGEVNHPRVVRSTGFANAIEHLTATPSP